MVVETCRAGANGNGPSETTHEPKVAMAKKRIANAMPAIRTRWRLLPGHDGEVWLLDALISPDAPRLSPCRCGHSARGCTCPRHKPAAARICPAIPPAPHRPP